MQSTIPYLSLAIWVPIAFGALVLTRAGDENARLARILALFGAIVSFLVTLPIVLNFDAQAHGMQFVESVPWIGRFNIFYALGIDGISLWFIPLTAFMTIIVVIAGWEVIQQRVSQYMGAFLILSGLMIGVFCAIDALLFYVFFEATLIPMFIIVGVWGGPRRVYAAIKFFLYTLLGSLLMLIALIYLYFESGGSFDVLAWHKLPLGMTAQTLVFFAFLFAFAVKVPMVPVHIWLPEAHVEAPTAGSVILAGILLKLGAYGFLRFSIPLFPIGSLFFTPLIHTLSVIAIIYTSLTTLRQVDLKKIIAYSSVAHMNFVTLGLFSLNPQGVEGAVILMIAHGLVSGGLFLCVGFLYDRHKTRLLHYYGGCSRTMPLFSIAFLFFTMANISLPGTSNFVGEFLVLTGAFQNNTLVATLGATGMVLGAAYALWLSNRLLYGLSKPSYLSSYSDLSRRESLLLLPFLVTILFIGVLPQPLLDTIHCSVASTLLLTGS